jgi:nicotinate phosphoribosyltransferase
MSAREYDGGPAPFGLYTDLYEIHMVESYLRLGMTEAATFSLFARPSRSRPVLVAAGLERVMEVLDGYRFARPQLDYLRSQGVSQQTIEWLAAMKVRGELWAVRDGTVVLAHEPLLELTAPLPVAQLLETALMNAVHYETLVATKAARLVRAARQRDVVDFGFRRAHGLESGLRAARAAYVGGCAATSSAEAGRRHGVPVSGTMAHSFVQSFDREIDVFREFARDHPEQAILLVETHDAVEGVENAIRVARELSGEGIGLAGIRIDSEPLDDLARKARAMLDGAGLQDVKIVLSGGLDEERIRAISDEGIPADSFGVGSALVVSSDEPALDMGYKLVEHAGQVRAKYTRNESTLPGRKQVFRRDHPLRDVLEQRDAAAEGTPLLEQCWRDGEGLVASSVEESRRRAASQLETIPDEWLLPPGPREAPVPRIGPELARRSDALRAGVFG